MPLTLVAPLNWGLGHATRCIPLIRQELSKGNEVLIAADGLALELLCSEFPGIATAKLPDIRINYSRFLPFFVNLSFQLPGILKHIGTEHRQLDALVSSYKPDMIISDNRYGLWHPKKKSILITHQVFPIAPPPVQFGLHWQLKRFMSRFHEVWIPDYPGEINLSGALSHSASMAKNIRFIGPLSRFSRCETPATDSTSRTYELVGVVSGPEPHRSLLLRELTEVFTASEKTSLILGGMPGKDDCKTIGKLTQVAHMDSSSLEKVLCQAGALFVRSGYSTIMDLHALGKSATVIPTPGQTEQEYLATLHSGSGWLRRTNQGRITLQ
jgi:predicted glycosyltransferase